MSDTRTAIVGLRNSDNTGFPAEIIEQLFLFCKKLDEDLDTRSGLMKKYFSVDSSVNAFHKATQKLRDVLTRLTPCDIGTMNTAQETATAREYRQLYHQSIAVLSSEAEVKESQDRKAFLYTVNSSGNPFYTFCKRLHAVLINLESSDVETIRRGKETPRAKEFQHCIEVLDIAGFYNVNGRRLNTWSGDEGQVKADTVETSCSNKNIPAIAVVSELGMLLRPDHRGLSDLIFDAVSAEFVGQATGPVINYNSATTVSERKKNVINEFNYFWKRELPTLEELRLLGVVTKISYCQYNPKTEVSEQKNENPALLTEQDFDPSLAVNPDYTPPSPLARDLGYFDSYPDIQAPLHVDTGLSLLTVDGTPSAQSAINTPLSTVEDYPAFQSPFNFNFDFDVDLSIHSVNEHSPAHSISDEDPWSTLADIDSVESAPRRKSLDGASPEEIKRDRLNWIQTAPPRESTPLSKRLLPDGRHDLLTPRPSHSPDLCTSPGPDSRRGSATHNELKAPPTFLSLFDSSSSAPSTPPALANRPLTPQRSQSLKLPRSLKIKSKPDKTGVDATVTIKHFFSN